MKRSRQLAIASITLTTLLFAAPSLQAQFSLGPGGISFGLPGSRGPNLQVRLPQQVSPTANFPRGGRPDYSAGPDRRSQPSWHVQPPVRRPAICRQKGPFVDPITAVEPPLTGTEEPPLAPVDQPSDREMSVPLRLTMQAKQAFTAGNYALATQTMNRVLKLSPESAAAYQFRAFTHFAQGNYDQAAADVYDTLLRGTLWNWETVYPLYGNARTYTYQYRDLSVATRADDNSMSKHFLLAYHHLVLGHLTHGERELQRVLEIQPEEPVTAQLLAVVQQLRMGNAVAQR